MYLQGVPYNIRMENTPSVPKKSFKKFLLLSGLVLALAVLVGASYIFAPGQWEKILPNNPAPEAEGGGNVIQGNGYTIEEIPVGELESIMPNLDRAIVFSGDLPEEAKKILRGNRDTLSADLKADATQGAKWLDLAITYHSANDYEGARLIWEFLTKVMPEGTVSYDNLGKLYHFTLRDFPKAESYFKQSIQINPASEIPYLELHQLYKYSYKTTTFAGVDILKQAAKQFPENPDFLILTGLEYRDRGDTANARIWLEKALTLARTKNNVELMGRIGDEIDKLP